MLAFFTEQWDFLPMFNFPNTNENEQSEQGPALKSLSS